MIVPHRAHERKAHMSRITPQFNAHQFTRRKFLKMLGAAGGAATVFSALEAWNLSTASGMDAPPPLDGNADGVRVVILGAGPAGLACAYELAQRGYDVTVLEARNRVGGHVFTVRGGQVSEEIGTLPQVAHFDEGQHYDAGAWRIPYIHRATLYYPKLFGIKMNVHMNVNGQAWTYMEGVPGQEGGRKQRLREVYTDMTGYTSELLAKAINQDQLDLELTQADRDALVDYLVQQGLLSSSDLSYGPNFNRGWEQLPGAGTQQGIPSTPPPFSSELIQFANVTSQHAGFYVALMAVVDQQETMQVPENGMSAIYEEGFLPRLKEQVRFYCDVLEIHQSPNQTWITYRDLQTGETKQHYADYCICTIPLSVLKNIPMDVSAQFKEAIEVGSNYASAGKIGLQFKRRFWEEDDWIYGGLSFSSQQEISSIAYPTYGFLTQKGVLQGYYNFGSAAAALSAMTPDERSEVALAGGELIHGDAYRSEFENAFSVAWDRVRYSLGSWSGWTSQGRQQYYPTLLEPDGRIYLAGEMLSWVPAWQEGAISAAWMQLEKLHERVMQSQPA